MKAIRYTELGGPEVLTYTDVPTPQPKPGEILMQVKAAAMNHLDIHFRRGLPTMKMPLPHIPGSDGAGIVEEVGSGISNLHKGDRVYMNPGFGCGTCERCQAGETSYCHKYQVLGRETDGTYAEFVSIPGRNAHLLPEYVSFETGAAAPVVYLTAWGMISKARITPGMTVLVMGAGSGVGMALVQIAKLFGATVFATASNKKKAELALTKLGADASLVYTEKSIDTEIRSLTHRRGVDVAFDHIGGEQWVPLLKSVRNGGTVVTCGATDGFEPKEDLRQIFYRQLRVIGSTMGNDAELTQVMQLIFDGKLSPIIDSVFSLKDAAAAHRKMESRQSFGKIVLTP